MFLKAITSVRGRIFGSFPPGLKFRSFFEHNEIKCERSYRKNGYFLAL
jgi:hypothetical protein